MQNVDIFRPKGNLAWGFGALALDGLFIAQAIFYPTGTLAIDLVVAALIASTATLLWLRPKLVLREVDLVVVNPFSAKVIRYRDITELETKWSLLIHHGEESTRVWVAPANGKQRWIADSARRWKFSRVPTSEVVQTEFTTVSESLSSDSGIAATLIRDRLRGLH